MRKVIRQTPVMRHAWKIPPNFIGCGLKQIEINFETLIKGQIKMSQKKAKDLISIHIRHSLLKLALSDSENLKQSVINLLGQTKINQHDKRNFSLA